MPNAKLAKRLTMTRDKILHNVIPMAKDVTVANTMCIATTPQKSVRSSSTGTKDTRTLKGRTDPMRPRRCASAVARPSLLRPCMMETKIYT
eukprot:6180417-Ditylum_brightwellii.AAC.1